MLDKKSSEINYVHKAESSLRGEESLSYELVSSHFMEPDFHCRDSQMSATEH
jgi:hypothetical protein